MSSYNYIRLTEAQLEELDYVICSQKRKYSAQIDSCAEIEDAKELFQGIDELEDIHNKVKKELKKCGKL